MVRSASSVEDLVEKVATKRHTKARAPHLDLHLAGGDGSSLPDAIHVLGIFRKGQAHLKGLKISRNRT